MAAKLRADKKIATFEELAVQLGENGFTDHNSQPFTDSKDAAALVELVYSRLQLQGLNEESEYIKQAFM